MPSHFDLDLHFNLIHSPSDSIPQMRGNDLVLKKREDVAQLTNSHGGGHCDFKSCKCRQNDILSTSRGCLGTSPVHLLHTYSSLSSSLSLSHPSTSNLQPCVMRQVYPPTEFVLKSLGKAAINLRPFLKEPETDRRTKMRHAAEARRSTPNADMSAAEVRRKHPAYSSEHDAVVSRRRELLASSTFNPPASTAPRNSHLTFNNFTNQFKGAPVPHALSARQQSKRSTPPARNIRRQSYPPRQDAGRVLQKRRRRAGVSLMACRCLCFVHVIIFLACSLAVFFSQGTRY